MDQAGIIFERIITLSLLGLIGYIAGKTKYLPDSAGSVLSSVVVKLTTPILIFTTLTNHRFTSKMIQDGLLIFLGGLFFIGLAYLLSSALAKGLKMPGQTANIFKMQAMFGNVIYLAFPLLGALYGDKGVVYALFYNLANDSLLWTLGVSLAHKNNGGSQKEQLKRLINGNTIAFAVGIIWVVLGVRERLEVFPAANKLYALFYETLHPLGVTTIYLSLLFIGLMLAKTGLRGIIRRKKMIPLILLSLGKLVILPGLAIGMVTTFAKGMSAFAKEILVLQLAMPTATIVPALAAEAGSDVEFATEAVFVTTVLSLFTLPLIVLMI